MQHLKMELAHSHYHDGWVIKGLKEELLKLNKDLDSYGKKQLYYKNNIVFYRKDKNMIRNVNKYIFIYIITLFVIGCSNPI